MAGQVQYAYTCKFCNRNPCACAQDICDVTQPLDPRGIASALASMKAEAEAGAETGAGPVEVLDSSPASTSSSSPASTAAPSSGGGVRVDTLFDDDDPLE